VRKIKGNVSRETLLFLCANILLRIRVKNHAKNCLKRVFLCATFFDALEAFIYKASRAYFFSRRK